ncbi:hypothetical protein [Bdellovibrio sp. HCB2-146]|uniref:hypothetical protein n=1 Tax=Bdellovibrio sp. HCB2-146 TaxID=3394362 RepID=UPI0039BD2879
MLKVGQLLKFVSDLNPQNTPTRLSFYNFLRGFPHPEDVLTPELIELFFNYCMDYPHWASNKQQLGHEVQFLLANFNKFYQQKFDVSPIRFPQHMQLIEIEHQSDLIDAVSSYVKTLCGEKDKFRVLPDQNKRVVAILLREDKSLEVRTYDRKFTIRNGRLEPLRTDLVLYYTDNLELSPHHSHRIEVAPYITAQFQINGDKVSGALLRGYVFQKLQEMKNEPLQEQTRVLFPIKRLEQFFVDRRTDPYYGDLVSELERTCALVQQGDSQAINWANIVLNKAETALDNVFLGDKLMTLLIRDLRHALHETAHKNLSSSALISDILSPQPLVAEADEECLKITPLKELDLIN